MVRAMSVLMLCALLVSGCAREPEGPGERIGRSIDELSRGLRDLGTTNTTGTGVSREEELARRERLLREREIAVQQRELELERRRYDYGSYDRSRESAGAGYPSQRDDARRWERERGTDPARSELDRHY